MLRVGLTGGLATGKSVVAEVFASLGSPLLKADELGHQLLRRGQPAFAPVLARFGEGILAPDGEIDRRALGALVFSQPAELSALNEIIHPLVFQYEQDWFTTIAQTQPHAVAVVEAAILIETGNYRSFDTLVVTWCPEPLQIQRALARGNATLADVQRRLARQMSASEKRNYARFVIDTSGSLADTISQAHAVHENLLSLEKERRPS
ncbi:MAG: dephospho-CoA kinase [Bryobacter sp.]|nr:dephospho-CoA kinase [Bryobacter sp.]